jgi:hypothetical protein
MRIIAVIALLLSVGCDLTEEEIDRRTACEEQAETWCDGSGDARLDTFACRTHWTYECGGPDYSGSVPELDQVECLEAMSAAESMPDVCVATWVQR